MSSETVISLNASEHPVKEVTIFHQSSTAQVTRTFKVDLKAGSNMLEISGIPSKVDQESPRIHGLGPRTDVRVVDTSCSTILAHDPHHNHTKNAAAAKQLASQHKRITAERAVRQTELTLLDDAVRALVNAKDSATTFDALMDAFVARKRGAARAVVELDGQIEELDRESWLLANSHAGETAAVVAATLRAKGDCRVAFQLTYLVTGATWEPCYDLHATTTSDGKPSPDVSLHYCASVTQSTGEDWADAVLSLSPANAHALRSLAVPEVDPLRLVPVRPPSSSTAGSIFGSTGSRQPQQQEQPQPQLQSLLEQQRRRQLLMQQLQQRQQQLQQLQQQPNLLRELRQHVRSFGHLANAAAPQPAVPVPVLSGYGQFLSLNSVAPPAPAPAGALAMARAPASAPAPAPPPVAVAPGPRAFMASAPFGSGPAHPPSPDEDEQFEDLALDGTSAVPDKQRTLSLAHRVSLPSDGAAHRVPIAVLALRAALTYVCVPRRARAAGAFIEGRIRNSNTSEGGYELRAGPVSVFMDGGFVAKTRLPEDVGANESFTCVLGIDTALKVVVQPRSRTAHEPRRSFAEPSKTTTRTVTTTITNGHAFDVAELVVRDAIPLGHGDARIEVVLRRPAGLAQAKDGEEVAVVLPGDADGEGKEVKVRWASEKEGLYEWVCELKAGERITLEAEWEVRAPSSMRWEELRMGVEAGQNKAV